MKTFVVLCLSLVVAINAMPNPNERVLYNVDPFFYGGNQVHVVDPGFYVRPPGGPYGNNNGVQVVDQPNNGVHVVNNPPGGSDVVISNPDSFFYQGGQGQGHGVIQNPDPGFYQGGQGVAIQNPDPGFYQGGQGGQSNLRPYIPRPSQNPWERSGK